MGCEVLWTVFLGWIYAKENTVCSFFNLHVRKLSNGSMNLPCCQFCTFSDANSIMSHTVSHVLIIWLLVCSLSYVFLFNLQLRGLVTAVRYSVTYKISQIWQTFMFCWQICCRLWSISANILETVDRIMKVCMKLVWNTYSKSYMAFQFTLLNLTLDDIDRSNQGHWVFNWLSFINEARYDFKVY